MTFPQFLIFSGVAVAWLTFVFRNVSCKHKHVTWPTGGYGAAPPPPPKHSAPALPTYLNWSRLARMPMRSRSCGRYRRNGRQQRRRIVRRSFRNLQEERAGNPQDEACLVPHIRRRQD
jgi:hypothetical protein